VRIADGEPRFLREGNDRKTADKVIR